MTDAEIIAAIRKMHLTIDVPPDAVLDWERATVDPGGTFFGPGLYLHVPVTTCDGDRLVVRANAPKRIRKRLAR